MGIKDLGTSIKQARMLAGLTQEQLSEGICTPLSLSRIETNKAGIRPETFQLLMQRTGRNCSVFPAFVSQTAFKEFLTLESAFFAISAGNPQEAYQQLKKLSTAQELKNNPYFYQKFQLAQVYVQLLSDNIDYKQLLKVLTGLLKITHPQFYIEKFPDSLLSVVDIRLLLALCEVFLHTGHEKLCLIYCDRLEHYLLQDSISFVDKIFFCAMSAIYRFEALLALEENTETCFDILNRLYHACADSHVPDILPQLYARLGLCLYAQGKTEEAVRIFKICYFSARSANHVFSAILYKRLKKFLNIELLTETEQAELLSLANCPWLNISQCPSIFMDDSAAKYSYRLGDIIRDLRVEKGITLASLCHGLCSKSTLSKIENNSLTPRKFLSNALLERLGLNGDLLHTYCNAKEFQIYELEHKCVYNSSLHTPEGTENVKRYLHELQLLLPESNSLIKQFSCSLQAAIMPKSEKSSEEYRRLVLEGLHATIPDFSETTSFPLLLSHNERILLNKLSINHFHRGQRVQAIRHLYKLLEYFEQNDIMALEKERNFPVTLSILCSYLYQEKRYAEILSLKPHISDASLQRKYNYLDKIFLYYSQALAETGKVSESVIYAKYSCALFSLNNEERISGEFATAFHDDFGIILY